jgi:hypothetical protein
MTEAWDCDPFFIHEECGVFSDIDEEDDEGDWQIVVLDRFGDRLVNGDW